MRVKRDLSGSATSRSPNCSAHGRRFASVHEDISGILEAVGCYRRPDEAIRRVVPGYGPGWKSKIVSSGVIEGNQLRFFLSSRSHRPEKGSRRD
jgi:NAD+ synthase